MECSTKNLSTPPKQLSGRLNGTVKHTMFCYPRYADYFITTKQNVQNTPCFIPAVTKAISIAESKSKAEYEAAHCRRLVAVFVGDEDYFYSVLVTLMSHYDIIVANPVGA